nr:hypothetical protein Iba_chr03bCG3820 [Ipomoea batatas]
MCITNVRKFDDEIQKARPTIVKMNYKIFVKRNLLHVLENIVIGLILREVLGCILIMVWLRLITSQDLHLMNLLCLPNKLNKSIIVVIHALD